RVPHVGIVASVVAAVPCFYWLWSLDAAFPREPADAGRELALPLYRNGSEAVGWWAMVVVLISDAIVIASFAFAYLFLWTVHPGAWPPKGSRPPELFGAATVGTL